MAELSQHFENLSIAINRALGGGEEEAPEVKPTKTWQEAQLACAEIFG
tara:strand:- start:2439 stop:2582 length:144 start_codon:yes stop_codon:yes gene_type:complete